MPKGLMLIKIKEMNLGNIKGQKRLHILAGLAQEIATSPTFMVGCPAQPYKNSLPQRFFLHHAICTVFSQ